MINARMIFVILPCAPGGNGPSINLWCFISQFSPVSYCNRPFSNYKNDDRLQIMYLFTLWKQKNIGLELINLNMPMHRGKIWLSTLIFYVRYGESTGSTCIFLKRACAAPLILASKSFFSSVLCWTTDSSILLERFCLFVLV